MEGAVLLFKGGEQTTRHETDHEPIMRQESFFAHLFGVTEQDCYATIDVPSGKATLFVPRLPKGVSEFDILTQLLYLSAVVITLLEFVLTVGLIFTEYAVWYGTIHPASSLAAKYGIEEGKYVDELLAWLEAHPAVAKAVAEAGSGETAQPIHTIFGVNSDTDASGPPLPNFTGFEDKLSRFSTSAKLRDCAVECRVFKSDAEVPKFITILVIIIDVLSLHFTCCFRVFLLFPTDCSPSARE
jgi:hypothetical protein